MIQEDYVSREIYNLLKEKGYDGEFKTCHDIEGYTYTAIHLYDAMKWLREVHNIFIQVELYSKYNNYCFELFQNTHRLPMGHREIYNSPEEACEAAIKYCLEKLI